MEPRSFKTIVSGRDVPFNHPIVTQSQIAKDILFQNSQGQNQLLLASRAPKKYFGLRLIWCAFARSRGSTSLWASEPSLSHWAQTVLELHKATDRSQRPESWRLELQMVWRSCSLQCIASPNFGGTTHRVPTLVKSNLKKMIVTLWIPPEIQQFATENCQCIELSISLY